MKTTRQLRLPVNLPPPLRRVQPGNGASNQLQSRSANELMQKGPHSTVKAFLLFAAKLVAARGPYYPQPWILQARQQPLYPLAQRLAIAALNAHMQRIG